MPFALGNTLNALGQTLGVITRKKRMDTPSAAPKNNSENHPRRLPFIRGIVTKKTSVAETSNRLLRRYRSKQSMSDAEAAPSKPVIRSETARAYVGSSADAYLASQRAYEASKQLRENHPRKLSMTNKPNVMAPEAAISHVSIRNTTAMLVKRRVEVQIDELEDRLYDGLPESPTQGKGKQRAREDVEDLQPKPKARRRSDVHIESFGDEIYEGLPESPTQDRREKRERRGLGGLIPRQSEVQIDALGDEMYERLPESPTRYKGKKRAREEDLMLGESRAPSDLDRPSDAKRLRLTASMGGSSSGARLPSRPSLKGRGAPRLKAKKKFKHTQLLPQPPPPSTASTSPRPISLPHIYIFATMPLTFGNALNALGEALGFVRRKDENEGTAPKPRDNTENQPPRQAKISVSSDRLSNRANYLPKGQRSTKFTSHAESSTKPKVRSDAARLYVGSSPKAYFASQRAYEASRQLRVNHPRKLTRENKLNVVAPEAAAPQAARRKRRSRHVKKRVEVEDSDEEFEDEVYDALPESPTRNKGKKRAREEDMNLGEEGTADNDGPSAPKRMRHSSSTASGAASISVATSSSTRTGGQSSGSAAHKELKSRVRLRSILKQKDETKKKSKKVTFTESVIFERKKEWKRRR
ncbi:hypothetical protein CVT24_001201 [Panaeolus cyanescens]|uniref:Uncharacterized protein n=1 Tax=Panaeolus cyanescens TaxID=181874 RepID=A0A409VTU5_9AGAR|nr:hypothetical protein CVT24_001201 [Panaeolus cyanescens]